MTETIDESKYKVHFTIMDNFINFSFELLRLSLLAIGGMGTLMLVIIKGENKIKILEDPTFFLLSLTSFTICCGASLAHRYCATDSMSWYVSFLRAEQSGNTEKAVLEKKGFHRLLKLSRYSLITSEVAFALGIMFFLGGVVDLFT